MKIASIDDVLVNFAAGRVSLEDTKQWLELDRQMAANAARIELLERICQAPEARRAERTPQQEQELEIMRSRGEL